MARGICNRLIEGDRFSNNAILAEVQWCLNTMLSASGFSAYRVATGLEGGDGDLLFAQDASLAGQLRMRAQRATLKEAPPASVDDYWRIAKPPIARRST